MIRTNIIVDPDIFVFKKFKIEQFLRHWHKIHQIDLNHFMSSNDSIYRSKCLELDLFCCGLGDFKKRYYNQHEVRFVLFL